MLPEMSTTNTMSMPSVLTLLSLRPNCGPASAATNRTSVAPRNTSKSDGPSADQTDDNDCAVATEENLSPPPRATRRSHHSHSGSASTSNSNHGFANLIALVAVKLLRGPPRHYREWDSRLQSVACRSRTSPQLHTRASYPQRQAEAARTSPDRTPEETR